MASNIPEKQGLIISLLIYVYFVYYNSINNKYVGLNLFSADTVFIRQNLTYKNSPRTEKNKIFILVVDT